MSELLVNDEIESSNPNGSPRIFCSFAKLIRAISLLWVVLILGIGLMIGALRWTSDSANPSLFGREALIVNSGSMEPRLHVGDLIVVRQLNLKQQKDLKVGDIITFREQANNKLLVTHRIQEISSDSNGQRSYITKGDANSGIDLTAVSAENVVGKLSFKVGRVGFILTSIEERNLVVFFALAMILGHWAVKVLEESPNSTTKEENS